MSIYQRTLEKNFTKHTWEKATLLMVPEFYLVTWSSVNLLQVTKKALSCLLFVCTIALSVELSMYQLSKHLSLCIFYQHFKFNASKTNTTLIPFNHSLFHTFWFPSVVPTYFYIDPDGKFQWDTFMLISNLFFKTYTKVLLYPELHRVLNQCLLNELVK